MNILPVSFYTKGTLIVARSLLGKILFRKINNNIYRGMIVETEAYLPYDPAAHSFRGYTKQRDALFQSPGTSYVYFIYGMYYCFNIITERNNYGSGVLIRALEDLDGLGSMNGPGKLCQKLRIDLSCNYCNVTDVRSNIWIGEGIKIPNDDIVQTTRIGISKATDYPWRFYIKSSNAVSKK